MPVIYFPGLDISKNFTVKFHLGIFVYRFNSLVNLQISPVVFVAKPSVYLQSHLLH